MFVISIIIISILLQLAAAYMALRLIKVTGNQWSWVFIAVAMVLQASRRVLTLIGLINGQVAASEVQTSELIGMVLSMLMAVGVGSIEPFFTAQARSIAERKLTEEKLRESEERFKSIFDNAMDGILVADVETKKLLMGNRKICEMLGFDENELKNMSAVDIHLEKDLPYVMEQFEKQVRGEIKLAKDIPIKRKDGSIFYVDTNASFIIIGGNKYIFGIFRDITERKKKEEELHKIRVMLTKAEEIARVGAWEWDIATNDLVWSNEVYRIYGMDPEKDKPKYEVVINTLAPECKNVFLKAIDDTLNRKKPFDGEYKMIGLDGNVRFTHTKGEVLYDGESHPIKMYGMVQDITEHRRAEEKLRESEEIFHQFMEHSPIYVFFKDENIRSTKLSRNYEKMLGRPISELLGKSMYDLFPSGLAKSMIADDMRILNEGKRVEVEEELNGRYYYTIKFPINAAGKPRYLAGFTIDITERKLAEEKIKESESRLKYAQQIAGLGFWDWNVSTGDLYWSDETYIHYGFKPQEFVPTFEKFCSIVHPDDLAYVLKNVNAALQNDAEYDIEFRFVRPSGEIRHLYTRGDVTRDTSGKAVRFAGSQIDITEKKQAEEERTELRAREHAARAEAEAARKLDQLKSMFIASTSHELKTPLNSIIGFTGVLLEGWSGDMTQEQKEYIDIIHSSARHLLSLVNDVIDISRLEAGKMDIHISEFKLKQLVDEAVSNLMAQSSEKGLPVSTEIDDITLRTDRMRLLQCVLNLLSNAIKYSTEGEIRITAKIIKNKAAISVIDTGIGIQKEDIPKLFMPFVRLESPLTMKTSGTGLGLYLTNKLAKEVLGGEVDVKSVYGKGSTFTLHIPVEPEKKE